jgi:HEAT repeat protein
LLLAPLGCGASNTPIGKVVTATKAMVELLRSIKDPASATAAIPKIQPAFADLASAQAALLQMMTDPAKVLSLMSSSQSEMAEMGRAKEQMDAELERIDNLKGLPVEFWNVIRVESAKALVAMLAGAPGGEELSGPLGQAQAMYDQYGPQRVLELKLEGVETGDKDAALQRLRELAGADAQVVDIEDPQDFDTALVTVAPVDDFDKFAKDIDFGEVTDQEKAKGEIVVQLPEAAPQAAEVEEPAPVDGTDGSEYVEDRRAVFDEYGNPIPTDAYAEPGMEIAEQPKGFRGLLERTARSRANNMVGMVTTIIAAERAAAEARAANGPQRGDRDYHAAMADLLYDPASTHHQRAVTELLEIKPTDVADKKIRARIANGYRQLAFAENSSGSPQAIDGLVHWGGKFSAPLLIQLLEKQSGGNDEAIFRGLGKAATPEAAAAIVKRLETNSGAGGEAAFAALSAMGPVAEPALIGVLPFEQPESNRAAIEVLGEIGTRKSLSILRRATKSENEEVREAALAALRSIQDRLRTEKATAQPNTAATPST